MAVSEEFEEPITHISWSPDADGVPLICGQCQEPIRLHLDEKNHVVDGECGCDELPSCFVFETI